VAPFNCTTVDSDTSTSETVLLFATGETRHPRVPAEGGAMLRDFARGLDAVLMDLALAVGRDGEGAKKLVRIDVSGAVNARSARRVSMAVGKAGEPADRDRLSIGAGGVWMARDGTVVEGYDEAPVAAHMKGREVEITIDLSLGRGRPRYGHAI
jgi:glutamate N-acetyltransferase / amino-acid N-acetyltransferase